MRRVVLVTLVLALTAQVASRALNQDAALTVRTAAPVGELSATRDSYEIRITFSEPMIAIGVTAQTARPSWLRITPEATADYYWSGTQTLLISTNVDAPLPRSTQYTVTVDSAAASIAGRRLAQPYVFSFTTPTPRLIETEFYRKNNRFDSPVVLALRFDQPMRAADVVAHAKVALNPHFWKDREMSNEARVLLAREDPDGLSRFDAKVAAARAVAAAADPLDVVVANEWNKERFKPAPELVVLETRTAPPSGAQLRVSLDEGLPGVEGNARHKAQSSLVYVEPMFFVRGPGCPSTCDPEDRYGRAIQTERPVKASTLRDALQAFDRTAGSATPLVRTAPQEDKRNYPDQYFSVSDLGLPSQPPRSRWSFHIAESLQAEDGQTLGYPGVVVIDMGDTLPGLGLAGSVWESANGPVMPLAVRNLEAITVDRLRLDATTVMPQLRGTLIAHPTAPTTRAVTASPNSVSIQPIDLAPVLSASGPGLARLQIDARILEGLDLSAKRIVPQLASWASLGRVIQVTNLGISVRHGTTSTLVFVSRLDSAAPVASARVRIVDARNQVVWQGVTGPDGVAMTPPLSVKLQDGEGPGFVVIAEHDNDTAFVSSTWFAASTLRWWSESPVSSSMRAALFTDRGVYKPGDTVHIKAIARAETETGAVLLPPDTRLHIHIFPNGRSRTVLERTVALSALGSMDVEWRLPSDAPLGNYLVSVRRLSRREDERDGDNVMQAWTNFQVAAYRAPDFRVDTEITSSSPIIGTTLKGRIDAAYLFGAPVADRPVTVEVSRSPDIVTPTPIIDRFPADRFTFGYLPSRTNDDWAGLSKTVALDAVGRAIVDVPTASDSGAAFRYSLEADVASVNGQHIANRSSFLVHPASFYIGIERPGYFVDTASGAHPSVVAVDLAGALASNVPVTLSLVKVDWEAVASGEGTQWRETETVIDQRQARTASAPVIVDVPVKTPGSYVLRAEARDSSARPTRTDVSFYAYGGGRSAWRTNEDHGIHLVPERETWAPGESARVMIQSPWEQATALLTVERGGVRSHRQFTLQSTQDVISIPLTEADVPNVYVEVLLVKGRTTDGANVTDDTDPGRPDYRVGSVELGVKDDAKRLRVSVTTDREEYLPRARATVSVTVTDAAQRPAPGEVTLWAVDYGILSLTNYPLPDVASAIYGRRAHLVHTLESRTQLIRRRQTTATQAQSALDTVAIQSMSGERTMGGLSEMVTVNNAESPGEETRRDFRSVVFWLGSVTTDARGRVSTTVTLPDSLTTYRIMAVANDRRSRFGEGDREIKASKPLAIMPAFPRFMTVGDRASFMATVTSIAGVSGPGVVDIASLDPTVLTFDRTSDTVTVSAGKSEPVTFPARAHASGTARVRMRVTAGSATDSFEVTLPVTLVTDTEVVAAYGDATSSPSSQRLMRPTAQTVSSAGRFSVSLASTALVGLTDSALYLRDYPFPCAEQKASRALALLFAAELNGAFSLGGSSADLRRDAAATIADLSRYSCGQLGFSLWPGQCLTTSTYLTAYVLHVWKVAESKGIAIDRDIAEMALMSLRDGGKLEDDSPWWTSVATAEAYKLKVLREYGKSDDDEIRRIAEHADRLPLVAISYLADASAEQPELKTIHDDLLRRLTNGTRLEADRAIVEERDEDALWWLWGSNAHSTAVVLEGLARRKEALDLIAPLAKGLLALRRNNRWEQTHENAAALEAMVSYYRAAEAETPNFTATVVLGGRPLGSARFTGRGASSQEVRLTMAELLRQMTGPFTDVTVARQGTGRVYYTARLETVRPQPAEAINRGVLVTRRYELFSDSGQTAATTFTRGDVIRVVVNVQLPKESGFVAVVDPLPAGFEPIGEGFATTAANLARQATTYRRDDQDFNWWRSGGFDHIEKHDDRVTAFATRLGAGRHEFSYLVRVTIAGEFRAAGTRAEEMYSPEVNGRAAAAVITVK